MFVDELRHVVGRFAKGEQPLVTPADGIAALAVGLAVLNSGKTRRTVRLNA
jgi:predicted dehydrogenase